MLLFKTPVSKDISNLTAFTLPTQFRSKRKITEKYVSVIQKIVKIVSLILIYVYYKRCWFRLFKWVLCWLDQNRNSPLN